MRCTFGFDVGTSSSKGVLVASDGTVLAVATRDHEVTRPAPGQVESDPRLWWQEFIEVCHELLERVEQAEVVAVGVSGMGPCLALVDADSEPVRPAILYGVDMRATAQMAALTAELGADEITRVGGSELTTQAVGPKLEWVHEHEPEVFARAARFHQPASWLVFQLTGAYLWDHHSASQCSPLYDLATQHWHQPWATRIARHLELPRLQWAGESAGPLTAAAAAATGLPAGIPVTTGTIDAWAEAASVGATRPGDLMLMYGTTMFLIATVEEPLRTASMWTTVGISPGTTCLAGGMATSGAITKWLSELTGEPDFAILTAEAEASPDGAHGLLMLPYFAGERTPIMDPDARGVLVGLTLSTTRGDLYRAALEATAHGVRHNLDTMRAAGAQIDRVVAVGGGTQGRLWTQLVSTIAGVEQVIPEVTVGAAYGMAWLAACLAATSSADQPPAIDDWNPAARVVRPNLEAAERMAQAHQHYLDLHLATAPVVHDLVRAVRTQPTSPDPITTETDVQEDDR